MLITTADGISYDPTNPAIAVIGPDGKSYPSVSAAQNAIRTNKRAATIQTAQANTNTSATNAITQDFLKTWGGINDKALASLDNVIKSIDEGVATGNSEIQSLITSLKNQAKTFEANYGGLESEAIAASREDIAARRKLTDQYMDLSEADYEGVAGRATADVRAASDRARGAEARELMSSGVDPTSGRFGVLTKKNYMQQARNEAIASNIARRGEKERITGVATTGLQVIDPTKSTDIAQNIQNQRAGLTTTEAGLVNVKSNLTNVANRSKADAVNQMTNIGRDYGSAGVTMLGQNVAANSGNRGVVTMTKDENGNYIT